MKEQGFKSFERRILSSISYWSNKLSRSGVKAIYLSLPFLKKLVKNIFRLVKRLTGFLLSLRLGVRPEFKENLRDFSLRKIARRMGKFRNIKFVDVKRIFFSKKAYRFYGFVLPVVFALIILRIASPISAQLQGFDERLSQYLASNDPEVGVEKDAQLNDQIYYVFENNKYIITDSIGAKGGVQSSGEYVAWNESVDGGWQIFLYHIPTKIKTQLTYSGNNINPKLSGGRIVWEGIRVDGNWRVFLYDGTSIGPISSGDHSFNPDIEGNFIVFSKRDINEQWRSTAYSINDRKEVDIDYGEDNQYVKLDGKNILIGYQGKVKRFSLNVEDLMLLELGALSPQSSTSLESIQKEIELLTGQ